MKQEALLKQANIYDTVGIRETAALFPNGHAVRTAFMNQMTASELCVLPLSALSPGQCELCSLLGRRLPLTAVQDAQIPSLRLAFLLLVSH